MLSACWMWELLQGAKLEQLLAVRLPAVAIYITLGYPSVSEAHAEQMIVHSLS